MIGISNLHRVPQLSAVKKQLNLMQSAIREKKYYRNLSTKTRFYGHLFLYVLQQMHSILLYNEN